MLRLAQLYLPCLFPSWRFFEEIGPSPRIEVRRAPDADWSELHEPPATLVPRQYLLRLFHSRDWNAHLYLVSTAIRHAVEPTHHTETTLNRIIAARIGGTRPFAFRIVFVAREGQRIGKFVDYESGPIDPAVS